jgi:hypothetical protein
MKGLVTLCLVTIFTSLTGCKEDSIQKDYKLYSNWELSNISTSNISWTKFKWVNGNLGSKFYERIAINIPCKISGLQNTVTFQFDTGADLTGVYETTFSSFYATNPELKNKIKPLNSSYKFYENLSLNFDSFSATNKSGFVYKDFGNIVGINANDTINTGTIGPDIFQNTVLLIDYPKKQFAICSTIPVDYASNLVDMTLDDLGRVILPLKLADKSLKILFDTGSSLFPIITDASKISLFSTSPDSDVIQVSSWGQLHNVTGKMVTDTFVLAGQTFSNVKAYGSTRDMGTGKNYDGITGNALFWDKTVVIDFKNKKFGVK